MDTNTTLKLASLAEKVLDKVYELYGQFAKVYITLEERVRNEGYNREALELVYDRHDEISLLLGRCKKKKELLTSENFIMTEQVYKRLKKELEGIYTEIDQMEKRITDSLGQYQ